MFVHFSSSEAKPRENEPPPPAETPHPLGGGAGAGVAAKPLPVSTSPKGENGALFGSSVLESDAVRYTLYWLELRGPGFRACTSHGVLIEGTKQCGMGLPYTTYFGSINSKKGKELSSGTSGMS